MVKGKKGEMLIENIVFLILNLAFLAILVLFLVKQGGSGSLYEETYSKQIALLIDSSRPGMEMEINLQDGYDIAKENGVPVDQVVVINNELNTVTVRLSQDGGDEYHFFNEVEAVGFPGRDSSNQYTGLYVLNIDHSGGAS